MEDRKDEISREKYRDKVFWKAYIRKPQRMEENISMETDQ
jgi:hypothetical protein